jgi:F420-dependent oxidoreductase-like protein
MRLRVVVEGQEGIDWPRLVSVAQLSESLGFEAFYRSDHYLSAVGLPSRPCLDAWATLAGLAAVTSRIRLGTLVSPVTFRHPSELAKVVTTVDHISGGRAELGLGAGWSAEEHAAFGFPFPDTRTRMTILAEQTEIVCRQWQGDRFDFSGQHYQLDGSDPRPLPVSRPRPYLVIGGAGGPGTTSVAARYADDYNTPYATVEQCAERRRRVAAGCEAIGRDPGTIAFTLMTGFVIGRDRLELHRRAERVMHYENAAGGVDEFLDSHREDWIVGSPEEAVARLRAYEGVGVDCVYLQHLDFEDDEALELIASEIAPAVAGAA